MSAQKSVLTSGPRWDGVLMLVRMVIRDNCVTRVERRISKKGVFRKEEVIPF